MEHFDRIRVRPCRIADGCGEPADGGVTMTELAVHNGVMRQRVVVGVAHGDGALDRGALDFHCVLLAAGGAGARRPFPIGTPTDS
jgi:hypothetical protein